MTGTIMTPSFALMPGLKTAWQDVDSSFERFCLTAGIEAVEPRWQLTNANTSPNGFNTTLMPHSIIHGDACFAYFNKIWGIPLSRSAPPPASGTFSPTSVKFTKGPAGYLMSC
jgi:hypothetical protein